KEGTMQTTLEPILSAHPFLQGLDQPVLALIVGCASNVRFDAGQYLFREGEEASEFYIIREGLVSVEIHVPERGSVTLQTVAAGGIVGWCWGFQADSLQRDARC